MSTNMLKMRTTNLSCVFSSVPVNATAAVVIGSKSVADEPSIEQYRESLKVRLGRIEALLKDRRVTAEQKKALGIRKLGIQEKLKALKRRLDFRGIENFIVDVAKERTLPGAWRLIMEEARRRFVQAESQRLTAEIDLAEIRAEGSAE